MITVHPNEHFLTEKKKFFCHGTLPLSGVHMLALTRHAPLKWRAYV